jgi:hypothetical protein
MVRLPLDLRYHYSAIHRRDVRRDIAKGAALQGLDLWAIAQDLGIGDLVD